MGFLLSLPILLLWWPLFLLLFVILPANREEDRDMKRQLDRAAAYRKQHNLEKLK